MLCQGDHSTPLLSHVLYVFSLPSLSFLGDINFNIISQLRKKRGVSGYSSVSYEKLFRLGLHVFTSDFSFSYKRGRLSVWWIVIGSQTWRGFNDGFPTFNCGWQTPTKPWRIDPFLSHVSSRWCLHCPRTKVISHPESKVFEDTNSWQRNYRLLFLVYCTNER